VKVLVTGGSGWIGQATCRALKRAGHEFVVFDRRDQGDVRDRTQVVRAIGRVDHVIHLAGLLGTHELFRNPHEAVEVNVLGSLNITRACADTGRVGLTEITMPRVNPSLYAATKACAMDLALAYVDSGYLQASFVRAYNAYGPGQAYGGDHPQKIVPTFASKGWAGEPLPIWGDGKLLTDLVHVDDIARMLVEAMRFGDGQTFDAGTGYAQPVLSVAERVIELTGRRSKVDHLDRRPGERLVSTDADYAGGKEGWDLLGGWHPVFDPERFAEAVESYRP
jgi:UDP-glucose 4-epimerase